MATKDYMLSEVATHNSRNDLWIVVQGKGERLGLGDILNLC
jgi:cytochrome b involved in lipid metabolism